jgi:hypothetical protein
MKLKIVQKWVRAQLHPYPELLEKRFLGLFRQILELYSRGDQTFFSQKQYWNLV